MHANAGGIHKRKALEPIDAHHLVFHLRLAAVTVDGFFEGGAAVLRAAVVLHIHQVAFLRHEHFPHADLSQPAVLHHLAVRAAIDIEDDGVFFSRVEVLGIDEPVVVPELAVCAGNGAQLHLAGGVTFQRIIGLMHFLVYFSVRGAAVNLVGGGGVGPGIQEPLAVRRELDMVPAAAAGELHGLIELGLFDGVFPGQFQLHLVQVVLHGRILGRGVIHVGAVVVHIVDIGRCRGQAAEGAQGVHQVEVPEAVPVVCAVEEKVCAALDEIDGIQGLHPGLIVFRKKGAHKVAGGGAVLVQLGVVLAAVQDLGIEAAAVRAPGDVGDVTFCGKVVYFQINGFSAGKIVHANGYLFRVHAVHGVFDLLELSGAGVDVQKGKPGNLVLVFAVKGHLAAVRRHVPAGINPKLVAAYRFSVYQVGPVGGGNHKALFPLVVPGEEATAVCEEGVALFGGFLGFVGKGAIGL